MIYLDLNATAPPDTEILRAALEYYLQYPANSSGLSLRSQNSNRAVEECRQMAARALDLETKQIIFTASASEANRIFITAHWLQCLREGKIFRPLFSRLEHPSVTELIKRLPYCEPLEYQIDKSGRLVSPEKIQAKVQTASCVIMMAVHNETGILLPVRELEEILTGSEIPILCDLSQAAAKFSPDSPVDINFMSQRKNKLMYFSIAGHKLGAGPGAGLLVRPNLPHARRLEEKTLEAGGNQEFGIRAGTHNLLAIRALALTLQKIRENPPDYRKLEHFTADFETRLKQQLAPLLKTEIIGEQAPRLAGTSLVMFPGAQIDFLIMALDRAGITVSTGTSCKSRSRTPSSGLLSLGYTEQQALSVVRFSYDCSFHHALQEQVVDELRKILPAVL